MLAEIERRATIAWYHKSWSYWPAPVRAAFLVGATGVAGAAVTAFYLAEPGCRTPSAVAARGRRATSAGSRRLYHVGGWIVNFAGQLFASIPPLWLYGGLAVMAALYATFFGLGAAAYRTLYRNS